RGGRAGRAAPGLPPRGRGPLLRDPHHHHGGGAGRPRGGRDAGRCGRDRDPRRHADRPALPAAQAGHAEAGRQGPRRPLRGGARVGPARARRREPGAAARVRAAAPREPATRGAAAARGGPEEVLSMPRGRRPRAQAGEPRPAPGRGKYYMISVGAKSYGIHPQTLRLYEREGLLKPSRTEGNTRLYSEDDLRQLEVILNLTRDLGVNLAGVEIILNMRRKMEQMQAEINEFLGHVRQELQKSNQDAEPDP